MSAAPRVSTADIARGAQQRTEPANATPTPSPAPNPDATMDTKPIVSREPDTAAIESRNLTSADAARPDIAATEARDAANRVANAVERRETAIERRDTAIEDRDSRLIEEDSAAPLFASDASQNFQHRWDTVQASFIDDPRKAVEEADALVAETMQRLAETFAQERDRLEHQFRRDAPETPSATSTEDLRIALRHYRSFFKRLLSV
jgi:hypothetical protein